MKICFLMSNICMFGGEQRVVSIVANELCKKHEITIVSEGGLEDKEVYYLDKAIKVEKIPEKKYTFFQKIINRINRKTNLILSFDKIIGYAYIPKNTILILRRLLKENFDVVIGVSGLWSILLGYLSNEINAITIGWEHNSYEAYFKTSQMYYWHLNNLFRKHVGKLDKCVVLNEEIKEKYRNDLGISSEVIYNPRSFICKRKSELVNKTFIASGRFTESKGFDYLIEAFNIFSRKNNEWKLQILGDGEQRKRLEDKICRYNLQHRIELLGYQYDVIPFLHDASVFIISSRWEGFPMSVVEALELGLPVISFNISAIRPLVTNYKEGLLVEPFECEQMADAMLTLAENQALREELAKNAIEKAESLRIENIIGQWEYLWS